VENVHSDRASVARAAAGRKVAGRDATNLSFRTVIDKKQPWPTPLTPRKRCHILGKRLIAFFGRNDEVVVKRGFGGLDHDHPRCSFLGCGSRAATYMSHRSSSEPAIGLSPEQLSTLLNCASTSLALANPDGALLFVNEGLSGALGYRQDELIGRTLESLLPPTELAPARRWLQQLSADSASAAPVRCRLQSKDGSWRWFKMVGQNCCNDPAVEGLVISFLDITELQRMEAERQVISDVVHALNETSNLDQLLLRIHQALKKVLYAENCFVALYDSRSRTFHFPFFVDQFDQTPAPQRLDRTCTALVFRTGRAMLIPQSEFDRLAAQDEVELVGSPSPAWLGVPLKTPLATIGVLVVQHYANDDAYDMRDLEFLDSVGGHIALAIDRRRSEDAIRKSESMFRLLFEHNPLPTWVFDSETLRFLQVNDAAVEQYGYSREEFECITAAEIRPEGERAAFVEEIRNWKRDAQYKTTWRHLRKDGKAFDVEVIAHQLEYAGRLVHLVVAQDLSERQLLEDQLRQAQKMEAIGRLAGGVAHDFNNLLMVIKGHTELLLNSLGKDDRNSRKIEQIDRAADRATSLTRQLLAFSRMQVLQPRVMNLNTVVEEMGKLIPRLIGEDIELLLRTAPDLGAVRADASQMEQVIMNLAVNSRDAMPNGGRLLIETSNAELDRHYSAARPVVQPGNYVLLAVSDSGHGMDAETQARIFEPFFTTKEQGKGTGLGLSTVYGVVKQSGGFIWVYSEVGKGTTFKIYLPRVDQPVEQTGAPQPFVEAPRGSETILLTEDEQDVRELAREFLESAGYTVLEARNGHKALQLAAEHAGSIDLLVTDMVMPGMTGQQLAARLQQQHPGLAVIYMSGYSEHVITEAAQLGSPVRLLTKPFSRNAILRAARDVLGAQRER
jgi:two-component system, cell cycle sensor histidine kinase and response regulator CckA